MHRETNNNIIFFFSSRFVTIVTFNGSSHAKLNRWWQQSLVSSALSSSKTIAFCSSKVFGQYAHGIFTQSINSEFISTSIVRWTNSFLFDIIRFDIFLSRFHSLCENDTQQFIVVVNCLYCVSLLHTLLLYILSLFALSHSHRQRTDVTEGMIYTNTIDFYGLWQSMYNRRNKKKNEIT